MQRTCTVIQGPFNAKIALKYPSDYDLGRVVSCWEGEYNFTPPLYVVRNIKPESPGYGNVNYQSITTLTGLQHAKLLGYTHAFKVRSDIYFSDYPRLLDALDPDVLNFLCYHKHNGGYLVDYFNFGPIDLMLKFWDYYDTEPEKPFAEKKLFDNAISKGLLNRVAYILPLLNKLDIDCHWVRNDKNLRDYAKDPLYTCDIKEFK